MIPPDTSALYALSDKADPDSITAFKEFDGALRAGETFLIHNYILVESAALLQAILGCPTAACFLKEVKSFDLEWIVKSCTRTLKKSWKESEHGG